MSHNLQQGKLAAYEICKGCFPFRSTGLYRINQGLLCTLTDKWIYLGLDDYADKINAWPDVGFEDGYDGCCEEDQGFDCYVELGVKLCMLSKLIRERN